MCMCGELNQSYVCSKHVGTSDDWRWWLDEGPKSPAEEAYERVSEYNDRAVLPVLRDAA